VGDLLDELAEPPSPGMGDAIPYLGETAIYEEILKVAARGKIVLNVSGTWVSRQPDHATDEDALRYVRSKAFRSGQEMRQIQMSLPAAVGGTTVTAPGASLPVVTVEPQVTHPGPGSLATPGQLGIPIPPSVGGGSVTIDSPVPQTVQTKRTDEPNTGINLTGSFEKWGIDSGTILNHAKVEFEGLSVQQLKQILQRLPSSVKASLEVSYPEEKS
jgi:hypothetical protein